jgi:streptomycin 6-kinase
MEELPPIDPEFRSEIVRRTPSAAECLDQLPGRFQNLVSRWHLSLDGSPKYGKTSIVLPVARPNRPSALKLVSPTGDIESEARTLQLFAGTATVQLLDISIPDRALLLDRLPGPMFVDHTDSPKAVEIAGGIAGQLGAVELPPDVPKLATQAIGWPMGLHQQHELANEMGIAMPDEIYQAARRIFTDLACDPSTNLTPGDLSLEIIMRASDEAWVAIDPLFICGTIANEAHTVVRSLLPLIMDSDSPGRLMADHTRRFCDAAGTDYATAQQLSLARYIASYYWEVQNYGDSSNIDRLRKGTMLTWQLIA